MEDFVAPLVSGGEIMLETLGTYVTQMFTWVGSAMTNANIQPFLLMGTSVGIVGAVVGLGKRITRIGSGRRR